MSAKENEGMDKLEELRAKIAKAEEARVEAQKFAEQVKEEMADAIPKLQAEVVKIDGKIQGLQEKKALINDQLRLLGMKVKKVTGKRAREGGFKTALKELVKNTAIGSSLTKEDITTAVGSTSGYVGMIIKEFIENGWIERTDPGVFRVTGHP